MFIQNFVKYLPIVFFATAPWSFSVEALELLALFSEAGIDGKVSLHQNPDSALHTIYFTVQLTNKNQFEGNQTWSWFITEFPVDYSLLSDRCNPSNVGGLVADLGDLFGPIVFTSNESIYFEFETSNENEFALVGPRGIWGRSLVLVGPNQEKACATMGVRNEEDEWVAEARFQSGVAGSVFFRWVGSRRNNVTDSIAFTNLIHTSNHTASRHLWKIYVTDILESEADKSRATCDFLQILFNPGDVQPALGDLSARLGPVAIGEIKSENSQSPISLFRDTGLPLLSADLLGGRRSLYLVLFDDKHPDSFLSCAKIRTHRPTILKSLIQSDGVAGVAILSQRTQFNPTWVKFNITAVAGRLRVVQGGCAVHALPPDPDIGAAPLRCTSTGPLYDPLPHHSGQGSQDRYAVGDLSGKHDRRNFVGEVINVWDLFLPLYGPHSVAHRSLVFYRYVDSLEKTPWVCNTLHRYQSVSSSRAVAMVSAKAVYRYPIVGTVVLRQPKDQPWADTTLFVEMLVHADGMSVNDSMEHRWSINVNAPGRDFYNWSMRCFSAGDVYNPFRISYVESPDYCSESRRWSCRVGELTGRLGTLGIAGSRRDAFRVSRRIFTDPLLPLSGPGSVLGRSLVIFDDYGPKARGDRLACSKIERQYRRKAVVKDWFSNGKRATVSGKLEFLQQSKYDVTNIDVTIEGLVDTSGYHIHMVPVHEQLEFPCADGTLYGHYNPLGVDPKSSPNSGAGTPDQYETGDLSGKFGVLDNKTSVVTSYNDTTITLFGYQSILGRSVIIHKRAKNARWICSSIERGYAPSEARELRAIASFHHPGGFAYGYVRMTQLVYKDGAKSDTIIEVNLRHPGKNDRNLTRNHNWAIYVNSVSVDASVKILNTRCTAGGYVWNPYYTQLADPLNGDLYRRECGVNNPLRCYVGDLSGRLGTIDLGDKRQVFTDGNVPLEGDVSAMGRSIIVFTPERGGERMACANIAPDNDIIKYANIRSTSEFVAAQFLEEFREIMGVPEWFLTIDTRQTKFLHGGTCVQFLLHFKGPDARKLELDFSHLLTVGHLAAPSIYIPGHFVSDKRKSKTSYRPCGTEDPTEAFENKRKKSNNNYFSSHAVLLTPLCLAISIPLSSTFLL